ncbi:MAG: Maltose/maltodextrin ABC transporter, permease protein MalF [uncultured Thermomicrobiales bacterium]|uniref:Maltose/maltodextrin ABC transporter, permease protein MalF n=1 Tax=uncultured Thermomicrobiales bacterium TaxID=1645740 RepID=A0A6J4UXL2_9BACT|nr:MAG: Maltose/maltodextrin ABC transporter, permease protein MalF [uncultured Thermomicrobiales bacterium]
MALSRARVLPVAPPRARRPRPGLFASIVRHWADYLYVAPALLVMVLVIGYPVVYTVYLSFFETPPRSGDWVWTGVGNYTETLGSARFWDTTRNTFYWTVGSTALAFVIGFGAALVVQRQFVGRGIVRAILLIPYVISHVAAAYVWRWFLHSDYGLVSGTLLDWGVIERPLVLFDSIRWVMPTVILVNVWKEFPFVMIMLLAGLQTVPDQLMRAAKVDGAGAWNRFWHVTVPHLKGVILITTLLLFVVNLNSFTLVYLMTGGGPAGASQLWITEIYNIAFRSLRYGEASAYSVVLFLIMLSMGYFYVKALTGGGKSQRRPA